MDIHISGQAAAAREHARQGDGKFGQQSFARASVDLADEDWMTPLEDTAPQRPAGFSVDETRTFTQDARSGRPPTQWGELGSRETVAPGIDIVSCAGHGGVKLSTERNQFVPGPLRNHDGWYEEDCEFHIPVAAYPEAFQQGAGPFWNRMSRDDVEDYALGRVREWFPHRYHDATGQDVPAEESTVVREYEYTMAHKNDFRVEYAQTLENGHVRVGAHRNIDGARTVFRMTRDEYRELRESTPPGVTGAAIDAENTALDTEAIAEKDRQQRQRELEHEEHAARATGEFWGNRQNLTRHERERLTAWEAKRFRMPDGSIRTQREIFENEPVYEIQQIINGDRPTWYASVLPEEPGGTTYLREIPRYVAKASTVPDATSDDTKQAILQIREDNKAERARLKAQHERYGW